MGNRRYTRWFDEIRADDVNLVGGKGANLGEMIAAGLPVPPGFCVTAHAYRDFVEETGLSREISSRMAELNPETPDRLDDGCADIRRLIMEGPVPVDISEAVVTSYGELALQMGSSPDAEALVAVRSSATAEDLPTASFAGQQETFLNVVGHESLMIRVRECWASLWTPRAVTYRVKQEFDHERVYLCVAIQAMIASEISGILFTANPITGARDEAVINASWGLGEAVVSGLVNPDTVTVRKSDGHIVSTEIGSKELTLERGEKGGTVEAPTPDDRREVAALGDDQVATLVSLARDIEAHYGVPQDIEWGYADGRFYILQSRAITTLAPVEEAAEAKDEFNRTMFIELLPHALSPIFLSALRPWLKDVLDFNFRLWGFSPPENIDAIGVFYNQPYFNMRYIEAALRPLSPGLRQRLVSQVANPWARHQQGSGGEASLPFLKMMVGSLRFLFSVPKAMPRLISGYRKEIADVAALRLEDASDEELVERIRSLVFGSASRLLNFDFALILLIRRTYQLLGTLLAPFYEEETDELRAKLISGVTGNATMETNKALWDLAQVAKSSPVVTDALRRTAPEEMGPVLQETPEGRGFLEALDGFLHTYGHREIRTDVLYPTWGEDPGPVLGFVRGYLESDESQGPHRQEARLAEQRRELEESVQGRLRSNLRGRYLVAPLFRWVLRHSQALTRERDTMHFELTRLIPPFRRLLFGLGNRWTDRDLIESPEDVFFLGLDELKEMAHSPRPAQDLVESRRAELEANRARPWPDIIRGGEETYSGAVDPAEASEGELRGIAGSPGQVRGVARIVRGPEEFGLLQPGEILVAPLTNPVWTPLFAVAGGVVTEVGGILSHGAIVAREYGIPAVMSVAGVTTLVQDGQELMVDGNRGIVQLSKEANS
ncbi:MAG: PEP/pyruvate-binding domain-containing protein [Anaerolineae bacterium]